MGGYEPVAIFVGMVGFLTRSGFGNEGLGSHKDWGASHLLFPIFCNLLLNYILGILFEEDIWTNLWDDVQPPLSEATGLCFCI